MNKVWLFILLSFVFLLFVGLISVVRGQKTSAESFFPILGNYTNKSVPLGGSLTVTPDSGASNIGTATISVSGNFKGSFTVSPTSGAIRVLNAYPTGTFTVTVRASDFAGFTLIQFMPRVISVSDNVEDLNLTANE
jgi:hypothetical protein